MNNPTLKEIASFLNGASALDGVWFGESHPDPKHVGMYWWRPILVKAIEESQASPPSGGEVVYQERIFQDHGIDRWEDCTEKEYAACPSYQRRILYTSPRVVDGEMILRAARALSDNAAKECGIDDQDNWNIYQGVYIKDATDAIQAALGEGK